MKKLLSLIAAAMFAVGGVNAQKEEPLKMSRVSNWSFDFVNVYENFTVKFNGTEKDYYFYKLIGTGNSIKKADYKGLEVLFERAESENSCAKLRVCYKNGPWDKFLNPGETTLSINFEEDKLDVVPDVLDDIIIQIDPGAENASIAASVLIKKINLIKHDDTKEQLKSCDGTCWGTSVLVEPRESATLKIPGRWSDIEFVDATNNKVSYNKDNNEKHFITVDLEEASNVDFQTLDGSGTSATYPGRFLANANRTCFVFTPYIDINGYNELRMQATTIDINDQNITEEEKSSAISYPQEIKVKSVKRGIIYPTSTATPNSNNTANWGTYSNNLANVQLSGDGVEVYNVTIDGEKLKFIKRADNIVAKGEGVIVKSSTNSFSVAVIESASKKEGKNLLKATPTTSQTITSDRETLYYLTKDDSHKLGFYRGAVDGKSLPNAQPGKAYLAISNTSQLSKTRSIDIDDPETTDIEGVKAERVQHDAIYNLAGQRVGKLSKGINIVGNKKVLVK